MSSLWQLIIQRVLFACLTQTDKGGTDDIRLFYHKSYLVNGFKTISFSPVLKSCSKGCKSSSPLAFEVCFNYMSSTRPPLCWACRSSNECRPGSWWPLTAPLMAPSPSPLTTTAPFPKGWSCYNKRTEMWVNIHQKERTGDSTSNMNGLSTGPLMCLVITDTLGLGWSAWCCEVPEEFFFS